MIPTELDATAAVSASSIDDDRVIEMTRELIATPSVNPFGADPSEGSREREAATLYAGFLEDIGATVSVHEITSGRPNVAATLDFGGSGPTLMLSGHLDTVGVSGMASPFDPVLANGRIHGRGACDMKGALSCFVEVARVLTSTDVELRGRLLIAATADEEDTMIGSRAWNGHGPVADMAIIGEPTSLAVCPAHKGQLGMRITTLGRAAHSSVPEEGVNAIAKMGSVIAAFSDYHDELRRRPAHPLCDTPSFSMGVISGGDIVSTVADRCTLEVDRRLMPDETTADVVAEYRQRLDGIAATDPDFRYEISEPTIESMALDTPLDAQVVTATVAAHQWAVGRRPEIYGLSGCTDAPNFACPSVICGPGSLARAHTIDEYVEIEELSLATRIYLHAALGLLATTTSSP